MPRKYKSSAPHGGRRQGRPGQAYQNRSDLTQAPRAVPGQVYGQAGAQLAAQRQVPLPKQAPPPSAPASAVSGPAGMVSPAGAAPAPMPGPLTAPSGRPGEPLTAGLPTGPGPGPEALGAAAAPPQDPTIATLKGILAAYPNPDLQALVLEAESAPR